MRAHEPDSLRATLLQQPFASVWTAGLLANLCVWMGDLAASWLMTSLTQSKLLVAMIQTATTLPVFLFAMPAGLLADRISRRDGVLYSQLWSAGVMGGIGALAWTGVLTPWLLLALVFCAGLATALRWPMLTALTPEVVARERLPVAISLNAVAINASRLAGPTLAGILVATWGGAAVFGLCALLALASCWTMTRVTRSQPVRAAPREPWRTAMGAGVAQVWRVPRLRANLIRGLMFFFSATALLGLLPTLARELGAGGPQVYAMLVGCQGAGAILAVLALQSLRRRLGYQGVAAGGMCLLGLCVFALALAPNPWLAAPAMVVAGAAWMVVGNSLSTTSQLLLPDHLRARGMSVFFASVMAGGAVGAAVWGAVADVVGLQHTLWALASVTFVIGWVTRKRLAIDP